MCDVHCKALTFSGTQHVFYLQKHTFFSLFGGALRLVRGGSSQIRKKESENRVPTHITPDDDEMKVGIIMMRMSY